MLLFSVSFSFHPPPPLLMEDRCSSFKQVLYEGLIVNCLVTDGSLIFKGCLEYR